ncbi:hypothetical protein SELMODRAFT_428985 [Selaginella moellendorffii]|uniref:Uncharacterized protein n=1 Tax=Selaginella moellendorffii TaxID=88036 RepID=D8T4N7_SELML|nr:uncharacterized protein LOC9631560 [Selaginella moellendorffii]EFJ08450.1 hypothetical protein SELMODRAFT_428985 [Selaginella moellendorffii]|eukprot:XP_002990573.1 uncharacterized protein LOC9631560 [Selaginella moellendorffii]
MVRARRLVRATIPRHVVGLPSPATPHSRRVAVQAPIDGGEACNVYIASASRIYRLKADLPCSSVLEGKEGLLVPSDSRILEAEKLEHCPHRAEVQCIALSNPSQEALLASVDSYGHLMVSKLSKGTSYAVSPPDPGAGEGGWAGCVFSPHQPSLITVARGFARSIDIYDRDVHVRTFHTLQCPTALTFLHGACPSVLAISEGPQLSIWDLRCGEQGGCVQRFLGSFTGESLYSVCSSWDNLLGAAGADRAVTIFDTRRWIPRARWVNALKYEVTGIAFSATKQSYVFAHGLDYEVAGGEWNEDDFEGTIKRSFGFRGDSRWLGMDKCLDKDFLAGWSENGSIFIADFEN